MIFLLLYSALLFMAFWIWIFWRPVIKMGQGLDFSVIIVVRNEAENILDLLKSIKNQSYRAHEIILVDDDSTDDTVKLAKSLNLANLKIITLNPDERGLSPKKNGIEKAVKVAVGNIIVTTDGDSILPPRLLEIYDGYFTDSEVQFVSGPVTLKGENSVFTQLQIVEFASLVGSAAVALLFRNPIMSSAANLAYRKSVFQEVGGYSGNKSLASGDDEFLMNKIVRKYPEGVIFAKNRDTVVRSSTARSFREFYHQRKRWAGKWSKSQNRSSQMVAVFIFLVNLLTIYFVMEGKYEIVAFRFAFEALFLGAVLIFLRQFKSLLFIPLTQVFYSFYVVFFGLLSLKPQKFTWKDRELS